MATRNKADHYWYARNTSKFMTKTSHLSLMEMGAYDRLLDWYYQNRKPLPLDRVQMHRICSAVAPDEQGAVDRVVQQFFTQQEDGWHNKTADEEIAKADGISLKRAEAQAERERLRLESQKKKGANAPQDAPANAPTTTTTTTIESISKDIASIERPTQNFSGEDFQEFFSAYPKPTAMGAARTSFANAILMRGADPKQIINAARNYKAKMDKEPEEEHRYIPKPTNWLDSDCYLDPDLQGTIESKASVDDFTGWQKSIAKAMGIHIAQTWFTKCEFDEVSKTIIAPSKFVCDHIKQQYPQKLRDILGVKDIILKKD